MYAILSPAKTQKFEVALSLVKTTKPQLLNDTKVLWQELREMSAPQLAELMTISDKLAELNYQRFQDFSLANFKLPSSTPAIFAFHGDVYRGLQADTLSEAELVFAQEHLGILSGFYGLLRPLDLMQAYRLEMKTKLENPRGSDLYVFWRDKLTKQINKMMKNHNNKVLLNLASNEYFKAVEQSVLDADVVTIDFKQYKEGKLRTNGMLAKYARGLMANYIIKNKIDDLKKLVKFNIDGYQHDSKLSTDDTLVFTK